MLYLVPLAEILLDLGITDSQDNLTITRWAEGLQARIETHLRRRLTRLAGEVEIFGGGARRLYLRRYPVESVSAIEIATDQDWAAGEALDADEFILRADQGEILYGTGAAAWPECAAGIRVTYTGGYVPAGTTPAAGQSAMPEDIRRAFSLQFGYEWRNRKTLGLASISAGGASVSLAPAKFLPEVAEALAPHRRMV